MKKISRKHKCLPVDITVRDDTVSVVVDKSIFNEEFLAMVAGGKAWMYWDGTYGYLSSTKLETSLPPIPPSASIVEEYLEQVEV